MTMNTPQEIVQALLDAGDTQTDIERGAGVSQATVSRLMSGQEGARWGTFDALRRYAERRLAAETDPAA